MDKGTRRAKASFKSNCTFITQTLARLGYWVTVIVLKSADFGIPQRRERIYIVGHKRSECLAKSDIFPNVKHYLDCIASNGVIPLSDFYNHVSKHSDDVLQKRGYTSTNEGKWVDEHRSYFKSHKIPFKAKYLTVEDIPLRARNLLNVADFWGLQPRGQSITVFLVMSVRQPKRARELGITATSHVTADLNCSIGWSVGSVAVDPCRNLSDFLHH